MWRSRRTAGSQSACSISATTANASSGGTGRVTAARVSITGLLHRVFASPLVHHCREDIRRLEAQVLVDALGNHVVLVDVQAAAGHVAEDLLAHRGEPGTRDATTAMLRCRVHALNLYNVGGPRGQLGLEEDFVAAHPDPAPAALDEADHPGAPRGRIDGERIDASLLPVHPGGREDERLQVVAGGEAYFGRGRYTEIAVVEDEQRL